MMSTQDSPTTRQVNGEAGILHFPLQGSLKEFTLAAHLQLRTVALLQSSAGEPSMLQEQQFEEDEFAFVLQLLAACPHPLAASAAKDGPGYSSAVLDRDSFWQKVSTLTFEVVMQGGYMLRPNDSFNPVLPEVADELNRLAPRQAFPLGSALVANQRLCTVSLLAQDPEVGVRLLWECALTPPQIALLLTVLNDHLQPVLQREVYAEIAQASLLYGSTWMEREGRVDYDLEQRYPTLHQQERDRAEQLTWQLLASLRPVLEPLGLEIRSEASYYLTPTRPAGNAPGCA
jgi:hypothetical protein